jgi:hypothetical protein
MSVEDHWSYRGLPIICPDRQGVGDIVTDACGIKFPGTTPYKLIIKLRDHLVALATDRARLESLPRGVLKRAGQFLWTHNGEQMVRIYFSVLVAYQIDRAIYQDRAAIESRILGGR